MRKFTSRILVFLVFRPPRYSPKLRLKYDEAATSISPFSPRSTFRLRLFVLEDVLNPMLGNVVVYICLTEVFILYSYLVQNLLNKSYAYLIFVTSQLSNKSLCLPAVLPVSSATNWQEKLVSHFTQLTATEESKKKSNLSVAFSVVLLFSVYFDWQLS